MALLEREQRQRERVAVGEERARIARELHDVVAHSVGVMVVQAQGARRLLDRDPERAREALETIEHTGRTALDEMRRSLGVLRRPDADAPLAPQPGMGDLGALLEQARQSGLTVELVTEGEPAPLPAGVDLSAYRIVQEALTNTLKHAGPVHARVPSATATGELELEISDDGAAGRAPNGARAPAGTGWWGCASASRSTAATCTPTTPGGRLRRACVAAARAMSIGVLIADDQALVRAGFRMVLEVEDDIAVVGEAANGEQAVHSAQRLKPDVVLMDIRMPELDGIAATRQIVQGAAGRRRC